MEAKNLIYPIYSALALAIFTVLSLVILWFAIDIFLLTFAGILLAIFLRTPANFIKQKFRLSDALSVSLVILAFFIIIAGLVSFFIPFISNQIDQFIDEISNSWGRLQHILDTYLGISNLGKFLPQRKNLLSNAATIFSTTFGFLGSLLVLLFIGIFFSIIPVLVTAPSPKGEGF